MFTSSVFTTLAFLATAFAAELSVSLSAVSPSVKSIDDIILTAIVTNPTKEDIKVLRHTSLLDNIPTRSFITKKDGEVVTFKGIFATISTDVEEAWVTIGAGQSIAVNHTVASLYDFESAGTGTFTFTPAITKFQTPDSTIAGTVAPVKVKVTEDVANRGTVSAQLSTPSCGDAGKNNVIATSLTEGRAQAGGAATDLRSHPSSGAWNAFFGGANHDAVWFTFDKVAGDLASSGTRKLFCQNDGFCATPGIVAYTLLVTSGGNIVGSDIYYCPYFFDNLGPTRQICSGAFESTWSGVTVHELSHAVSATQDTRYGCEAVKSLSSSEKQNNADNYRCFAAQIYHDYNC